MGPRSPGAGTRAFGAQRGVSPSTRRSPQYVPVNQHAYGGARMGSDAEHFVLDEWGLSHEVGNLAVLGGAGALSCGGRNPTQTFQAMAWRTADHVVKRWRTLTA